jgi:co-chaperonin GroES (HSP10)
MAKKVLVTTAQRTAAKAIVKRDAAKGRSTRASIVAIASAKGSESNTSREWGVK